MEYILIGGGGLVALTSGLAAFIFGVAYKTINQYRSKKKNGPS